MTPAVATCASKPGTSSPTAIAPARWRPADRIPTAAADRPPHPVRSGRAGPALPAAGRRRKRLSGSTSCRITSSTASSFSRPGENSGARSCWRSAAVRGTPRRTRYRSIHRRPAAAAGPPGPAPGESRRTRRRQSGRSAAAPIAGDRLPLAMRSSSAAMDPGMEEQPPTPPSIPRPREPRRASADLAATAE